MNTFDTVRIDRRTAIKWVIAASAALQVPLSIAEEIAQSAAAKGYGKDPNLLEAYTPGKLWPLTLSQQQRRTASALSDAILPTDGEWPAASKLGAVEFVDEWVSAPYEPMKADRALILEGLAWLDTEAQRRFGTRFADLEPTQVAKICDDICPGPNAKQELERATTFFTRYRALVAAAYYTTPIGMRDIGYVGNMPLTKFDGPPREVLKKIGL
jgi:hypothetical protein